MSRPIVPLGGVRRAPTRATTYAPPRVTARDVKIYGRNACEALFRARPGDVRRAFVNERTARAMGAMLSELARRRLPYRVVSDEELARVAGSQHHEGVCLVARPRPEPDERAVFAVRGPARAVYLDGVENPHNVGAILRTAAHFGVIALAGARDRLPAPAGAVARVAEGGAEHVPVVRFADPLASLRALSKEFALVATAHDARESVFEARLPERCVILLGAEGRGLSAKVRALASMAVAIPGTGAVESLNVASAAAVLLAEHYRRFGR